MKTAEITRVVYALRQHNVIDLLSKY